jgi:hypothetical protein
MIPFALEDIIGSIHFLYTNINAVHPTTSSAINIFSKQRNKQTSQYIPAIVFEVARRAAKRYKAHHLTPSHAGN